MSEREKREEHYRYAIPAMVDSIVLAVEAWTSAPDVPADALLFFQHIGAACSGYRASIANADADDSENRRACEMTTDRAAFEAALDLLILYVAVDIDLSAMISEEAEEASPEAVEARKSVLVLYDALAAERDAAVAALGQHYKETRRL